ncbi:PfkB family carbohydrate kinase [Plantactinospora endophytica]|uniref:Ribokinase n=1 Tax=Plantactinospora endophytica TaxID=673535 RepID=A0ABQ4DZZ8_9ACTN|nr:PfkB family carbohydrate kinase [Plantactinospora endophytica]GIG88002.1 ribokinase [Plantactinospora endophytica]
MSTVVVVGSVNVDLVAVGDRMPLPGETVVMSRFTETHGGKGGNQAAAAATLGATTHLVAALGDDQRGTAARADLANRGVLVDAVSTVPGPTGIAIVLVDEAGENSIAIVAGANAEVTPALVTSALADVRGDDVVVVACLEVPLDAVQAAAATARARGWCFLLNPAPARPLPAALLGLVSVLTPNESELSALGGVDRLLGMGVQAVVVTRGDAGCTIHPAGADPISVPACPAAVVDTTGAGDVFTAALAVALSEGQPLDEAARSATAAGAIATEGFGARGSVPSLSQVRARMTERATPNHRNR